MSDNDINSILNLDKEYKNYKHFIIGILRKYKIYRKKNSKYYIPQCFSKIKPKIDEIKTDLDLIEINIHYKYMEIRLIHMFILQIIDEERYIFKYWRNGIYFETNKYKKSIAIIEESNKCINIKINGFDDIKEILKDIVRIFNIINKDFGNLEIITSDIFINGNKSTITNNECIEYSFLNSIEKFILTNFYPKLKIINIFLASSEELNTDREEIKNHINSINDIWLAENIRIKLFDFNEYSNAVLKTRSQEEYNNIIINQCDIFIALFGTKIGNYTKEEFDIAYNKYKNTDKPYIYVYFKNVETRLWDIDKNNVIKLWSFCEWLQKTMEHYTNYYNNIDELKVRLIKMLEQCKKKVFI